MSGRSGLKGYLVILLLGFLLVIGFSNCKNPLVSMIDEEVTVAVTPPEVVSIFPENADNDVPITLSTITVTLSKYIDPNSVSSITFYVVDASGNPVNGSRKVENESITFTPNVSLSVGTEYTVTIDGVKDIDGNSIGEQYIWKFTTGIDGDTVKPVVDSVTINNGDVWATSSTVTVDVTATDNFGIAQMNVSTSGSFSDAGWIPWAETFQMELPSGEGLKSVYVKIKDGSGLVSDDYKSAMINLDTISPVKDQFDINGGNAGTREDAVYISIAGSDTADGSGIYEYRIRSEEADWGDWASIEGGLIELADQPLTVSSGETETFYLQFKDLAGNNSEIYTSSIERDFTPPQVNTDDSFPVPNSGNNSAQSYVKIVFSEQMNTSTIANSTVYVSLGTEKITTTESMKPITDKKTVEFTSFELGGQPYVLEQDTSYTVFISGDVTDVAGNPLSGDYSYGFSNGRFIDTQAPEGIIVLNLDNKTNNATALTSFDLMITAEDDYNGVQAVKVWGPNNDGGDAQFEADASWMLFGFDDTTSGGIPFMRFSSTNPGGNWELPVSQGEYYIYYRFLDYANNESDTPGVLKVNYDSSYPLLNNVQTDSGTGYSNNVLNTGNILLDATDDIIVGVKGSGVDLMWIEVRPSDAPAATTEMADIDDDSDGIGDWWEDFAPLKASFPITMYDSNSDGTEEDFGEGEYTIYAQVQDKVLLRSSVVTSSVILDYTKPRIFFNNDHIVFTNSIAQQQADITDPHADYDPDDPGALADYQIGSGIYSYEWELVEGPVGLAEYSLKFYDDADKTTETNTTAAPYMEIASVDGSEDGVYQLKVTVTDNAGNSDEGFVDFTWDTIDPDDLGMLTVFNEAGTAVNTSDSSTMIYTNNGQPYLTWSSIGNADFYVGISFDSDLLDPKDNPGVPRGNEDWHSYWDDSDVDWNSSATYESYGYIKTDIPYIIAPTPASPGDNDGPIYFYVSAWDKAGNHSNRIADEMVPFWIDTLSPVIEDIQVLSPKKESYQLSFQQTAGGDGLVYDQKTLNEPLYSGDIKGSGLNSASITWTQTAGPAGGIINFNGGQTGTLTPTVSANLDGEYELELTVADLAGNTTSNSIVFIWDTTEPNPVTVSGADRTPDLTPTWSWTSGGGGGNGTFEYQLEYNGSPVSGYEWQTTQNTYFTPGANLSNGLTYTLYVREYDEAGNYSDETNPVSSHAIWVDTSYKTAPTVTLSGAYLRNADNRSVTWTFGSGIGEPSSEYYRYWIEDDSGNDEIGSSASPITIGPFTSGNAIRTVDLSSLTDDVYIIYVQEFDSVNFDYVSENAEGWDSTSTYIGSSSVQIDATPPASPIMSTVSTGSTNSGSDDPTCNLTNDNTPYFRWSSGGGGIGSYRWSFNESSWVYTSSYYVYTSLAEGYHTFYVQERDTAGNWSDSAEYYIEIDITAPSVDTLTLYNRAASAYNSTSRTLESYVDIGNVSGTGTNNRTWLTNDIAYMRFWNSGNPPADDEDGWVTFSAMKDDWYLESTANGTKYVYCQLRDRAGNISLSKYDTIILDTITPTYSSMSLNAGATSTSSETVSIDSSFSTSDVYRMRMSNDNGSSWSDWVTDATAKSWTLDTTRGYGGFGAKKVVVQITDYAGWLCRNTSTGTVPNNHYAQRTDYIFYGTPSISYATKGQLNDGTVDGSIEVFFNDYDDTFTNANSYRLYYSTTPGGGTAYVSTNDLSYVRTLSEGYMYYFKIRVYNSNIGYSDYSSSNEADYPNICGWSSDMAIVYDDDETADYTLASNLKSFITYPWIDHTSFSPGSYLIYNKLLGRWVTIYYSDPSWTVTLVPENTLSATYSDPKTILHGDPIIVTPAVDLTTTKIRNIVAGGKGVLGMYSAGYLINYYTNYYWDSWGLTGTRPTEIASASYRGGPTTYTDTYTDVDSKSMWYKYFYYDYGGTAYDSTYFSTARDNYGIFLSGSTESYGEALRYAVQYTGTTIPTAAETYFYTKDPDSSEYWTVVRQGRFGYWGYNKIPYFNRGKPLLHNLIRYLNSAY